MKITPNNNVVPTSLSDQIQKNQDQGTQSFSSILKETIDSNTKAPQETVAPPALDPLAAIQPTSTTTSAVSTVDKTAKLLDTLEAYGQKLADPSANLKSIYPLLEDLEAQQADLMPKLNGLADDDGLKPILNQALSAASIESTKFRRGDYND